MTPERWQQVDRLFHAAIEIEPGERPAFLAQSCADDESLRNEVESLLLSHGTTDSFFETPVSDIAADLLAEAESKLTAGQSVGPYKILSLLGEGGMGEVYLATDTRLVRQVALKLLPPRFTLDAERVRRFEQEARAASALNHPNIVTIFEIGHWNGAQFIVTEFVEGKTLRQLMNEKPLTLNETLNVGIQIAGALTAAHAAGIVHRDIKPENIMLRADGYLKILDFGLAKLTERSTSGSQPDNPTLMQSNPGLVMGTVQYMSPEQARGIKVDGRTDVWSLGVVLYELVTGAVPFSGETPSHVMVSIMEAELPPLAERGTVPAELDRIVAQSLRKNKKERYQTARELAHDLKNLKQELQLEGRLNQSLQRHDGKKLSDRPKLVSASPRSAHTQNIGIAQSTSSAQYLVTEIKRHRLAAGIAAAALLTAIVFGGYFLVHRARNAVVRNSTDAIESIAVLPFANVGNDPSTEYLCDGISDSIISSLSRLPALKVMSLNSVLPYKGKQTDSQAVGKALNVRAVLMGRLTKQGDSLVITTELVDVRDNRRLWDGHYNRKLSDILVVQDEIAREISGNLRLLLSAQDKKELAKQYTQNNEAYLLYSLGIYYFRQNTKEGFEKSIESFEQAIKMDPNYALAYAGLAHTYYWMGTRGFWPTKESEQKLEWAALKALQLDDTLAEAHAYLGVNKTSNFDWVGAEKEIKRALELDPNSYLANFSYSHYLMSIGRVDEGLPYAIRAQELDSTASPGELAFAYYVARQYDKAIELYRKAIEKKPDNAHAHILLGETYVAKGMHAEAVAEMEKGMALDATLTRTPERWDRYPMLAYAYAAAGRRGEALKILDEQKRLAKQRYVSPYNFAIIYTGLGDKDRAFEWLAKAIEERTLIIHHLKSRPLFDPLRSDPRYADLLRRMNLEP
jgi:serine/threonine protein kinase/Tfp pilus assembly protein PilF